MNTKLKIIGITGPVGTGKSTVARIYAQIHNAYVIFTDDVAKELQQRGKSCYNHIVEYFGKRILDTRDEIDREKLASIVFNDSKELSILNSIVHKEVVDMVRNVIHKLNDEGLYSTIIIESAILYQVKELVDMCDEVWYVESTDNDRRTRLKRERNYSDERIDAMMNSQEYIHIIKEQCNKVIFNDKNIEKLKELLATM